MLQLGLYNPETLFETLKESGILDNDYKYKVFCAFLEIRDFDDFERKVEERGEYWDDGIYLYSGYDWDDYGRERLNDCGYEIPEFLEAYIDFDKYGRACGDCYVHEYSDGLIEIL